MNTHIYCIPEAFPIPIITSTIFLFSQLLAPLGITILDGMDFDIYHPSQQQVFSDRP